MGWVFGLCEKGGGKSKFFSVENRSAETLISIILSNVDLNCGAKISDSWRSYLGIADHGYTHYMVNHSVEFVREEPGYIVP